ncbi:MAG: nicotinate-nucleotide adenylyltransferase [Gemmatimonadales bacterium]|jgi:nicotinate-nucleotide adenylyltransferase
MRLGIFGGTFDPPHIGHLIVADDVMAALELDRIVFIPTGTHPLKRDKVEAPSHLRLEMIRAATAGAQRFVVDEREMRRVGPSYTIDTVTEYGEELPGAELYLLIGSDILSEIHRWHSVIQIAERARIVVMSRPDAPEDTFGPTTDLETTRVNVTHVEISSSEIRERVRVGRAFRYLVPEGVYEIIAEHSLYRSSEQVSEMKEE